MTIRKIAKVIVNIAIFTIVAVCENKSTAPMNTRLIVDICAVSSFHAKITNHGHGGSNLFCELSDETKSDKNVNSILIQLQIQDTAYLHH